MDEQTDVFTGQIDRYNGITIDTQQTAINLDRFPQQLESKYFKIYFDVSCTTEI